MSDIILGFDHPVVAVRDMESARPGSNLTRRRLEKIAVAARGRCC